MTLAGHQSAIDLLCDCSPESVEILDDAARQSTVERFDGQPRTTVTEAVSAAFDFYPRFG